MSTFRIRADSPHVDARGRVATLVRPSQLPGHLYVEVAGIGRFVVDGERDLEPVTNALAGRALALLANDGTAGGHYRGGVNGAACVLAAAALGSERVDDVAVARVLGLVPATVRRHLLAYGFTRRAGVLEFPTTD